MQIKDVEELCNFQMSLRYIYVLMSHAESKGILGHLRMLKNFDDFYSYKAEPFKDLRHELRMTSSLRKRLDLKFKYIATKEGIPQKFVIETAAMFLKIYNKLESLTLEALHLSISQFRNDHKIRQKIDDAINFTP